jgi:ribosome maturation factor RimP
MRHVSDELRALFSPTVTGLGYELLSVLRIKANNESLLRIYIDHPEGIKIADCTKVSHQLSGLLEVEQPIKEGYTLEVSSPGVDRLLFDLSHFQRFVGYSVKIWLKTKINGRARILGKILRIEGQSIIISDGDQEFCLALDGIDKARLASINQVNQ